MAVSWKHYLGGSIAIIVAVLTWQLQAELLQGLQEETSPNYFDKPYFLVWYISTGYSIFVPVWLFLRIRMEAKEKTFKEIFSHPQSSLLRDEEYWVVLVATVSSLPYFICGWFWYLSFAHTSVTANTAIYDSSFVFVFLLSILLLHERVSLLKIASVVVSFIGLMIIVWAGSQSYESGIEQTLMGYILVGLSTVLYAVYEVIYKKYGSKRSKRSKPQKHSQELSVDAKNINEEDNISELQQQQETESGEEEEEEAEEPKIPLESSFLFLGTIGVVTFIGYWPGMILLNYLGLEIFEWPNWSITKLLLLNICLDSTNNISLLLGISWTTPLFVGVGSLLNIPVSIMLDITIHDYLLPAFGFVGIACIIIGFLLLILADYIIDLSLKPSTAIKRSEESEISDFRAFAAALLFWSWMF